MKFVSILVAAALLFALPGCGGQDIVRTDIEQYGQLRKSAESIFPEALYLPSEERVASYGQDLYYRESKSLLGDKSLVLSVLLGFPDSSTLEAELNSLSPALPEPVEYGGMLLYPLRLSPEAMGTYLDGEILDGMYYDFEFLVSDPDSSSLLVFLAHVWDYFEDEQLVQWLGNIQAAQAETIIP